MYVYSIYVFFSDVLVGWLSPFVAFVYSPRQIELTYLTLVLFEGGRFFVTYFRDI